MPANDLEYFYELIEVDRMTYEEVIKYFGTAYKVHQSTDFAPRTAYTWKKIGFIPIKAQMKLEVITGGALKASLDHVTREK